MATVVVDHNGTADTLRCLRSLESPGIAAHRVIVVDNGSSPSPLPEIEARHPDVVTRRSEDNLGFAGGGNLGIAAARDLGAAYVFLLNNDATIDPRTLPLLVEHLEADERVGAVGPAVLYDSADDRVWSAGDRLRPWVGLIEHPFLGRPAGELPPDPFDAMLLSGCALLIRASVFDRVGMLPEEYFLYGEDVDFCLRARAAGWSLRVVPSARVRHRVSASVAADSPRQHYYLERNHLRLFRRHLRPWHWPGAIACILARAFGREAISALRHGKPFRATMSAIGRGVFDGFAGRSGPAPDAIAKSGRSRAQAESASR